MHICVYCKIEKDQYYGAQAEGKIPFGWQNPASQKKTFELCLESE